MRADLEAQAQAERVAVSELQAQADAPIRLPPVELITERVLGLKALTESADVDGARATLRRYLKDGQITLTPEPFGDAQAYTTRAEFLPLVMLTDKAETPSQIALGGSCPRLVARGRNAGAVHQGLRRLVAVVPLLLAAWLNPGTAAALALLRQIPLPHGNANASLSTFFPQSLVTDGVNVWAGWYSTGGAFRSAVTRMVRRSAQLGSSPKIQSAASSTCCKSSNQPTRKTAFTSGKASHSCRT
jgi:hypothetical protein